MLDSARKVEAEKHAISLIEQCDIAFVSQGTPEYLSELKEFFKGRVMTEKEREKRRNPRVFDIGDPDDAKRFAGTLQMFINQGQNLARK